MDFSTFIFFLVTSIFHLTAFDRTTHTTNYTINGLSMEDCTKRCNNTVSCYDSKWEIFGSSTTCEMYERKSVKNERWKSSPFTISTTCLKPKGEFEECNLGEPNF